jgi:hypothetical protein
VKKNAPLTNWASKLDRSNTALNLSARVILNVVTNPKMKKIIPIKAIPTA